MLASLKGVIDGEIERLGSLSHLDAEREAHAAFAAERAQGFVGRAGYLELIERYLVDGAAHPLCVFSEGGLGKSALVATAAARALQAHPAAVQLSRYIGVTAASAEPRALLQDLCAEIGEAYGSTDAGAIHPAGAAAGVARASGARDPRAASCGLHRLARPTLGGGRNQRLVVAFGAARERPPRRYDAPRRVPGRPARTPARRQCRGARADAGRRGWRAARCLAGGRGADAAARPARGGPRQVRRLRVSAVPAPRVRGGEAVERRGRGRVAGSGRARRNRRSVRAPLLGARPRARGARARIPRRRPTSGSDYPRTNSSTRSRSTITRGPSSRRVRSGRCRCGDCRWSCGRACTSIWHRT